MQIYEAEETGNLYERDDSVYIYDNEREGTEAVGLAVTQLRRRLIVSLVKTKGIWNNGQIGAFT